MKRKNPETSTEAYRSLKKEQLSKTKRDILAALLIIKEGTFEDIAKQMGVDDDVVWKRLSELHEDGKIYRPRNKRPLKSGRKGFTWMLVTPGVSPKAVTESIMPGPSVSDYSKNITKGFVQQDLFR